MADLPLVSVVLPTYNEAGNIIDLVKEIHAAVRQPLEIIVVDDNSPDGTSQLVSDLIKSGSVPGLRLETRLTDRGLVKSIRRGIELSTGEIVCWMDCDFSMPPSLFPSMIEKIELGADLVVGSRFIPGGSAKPAGSKGESTLVIILSRLLNIVAWLTVSLRFHDYTSGFIAARRSVLLSLPFEGGHGEYFITLVGLALLRKKRVEEVPYACTARRSGESKTGASLTVIWKYGKGYLRALGSLWLVRLTGSANR